MEPLNQETNQYPQPNPIQKPSILGKNFIFLLTILIISFVGAGLLYATQYAYKEIEKQKVEVSVPVSDPYAGWQTYRNEKYEFEFKYPSQYSIEESSPEVTCPDTPYRCMSSLPVEYRNNLIDEKDLISLTRQGTDDQSIKISITPFSSNRFVEPIAFYDDYYFLDLREGKDFVVKNANKSVDEVDSFYYDTYGMSGAALIRNLFVFHEDKRIHLSVISYVPLETQVEINMFKENIKKIQGDSINSTLVKPSLGYSLNFTDSFKRQHHEYIEGFEFSTELLNQIISTFKFTK